jgi:pseudoazurin
MRRILATLALTAIGASEPFTVTAAVEYQVQMRNKDSDGQMWQYETAFLKIAPGDTARFVPADKGHNSQTTDMLVPKGATPWRGAISEEIKITYSQEGVYLYECLPHARLGMVGIMQVGDSTANLDTIGRVEMPRKAKSRLAELIAQVEK